MASNKKWGKKVEKSWEVTQIKVSRGACSATLASKKRKIIDKKKIR